MPALIKNLVIIDDSLSDIRLVGETLANENPLGITVNSYTSWSDAYSDLTEVFYVKNSLYKNLVFLDLNMPLVSGFECLSLIRKNPILASAVVIIFTSSQNPVDVARSYALGANAYLVKPLDFSDFSDLIHKTLCFWFNIALFTEGSFPDRGLD